MIRVTLYALTGMLLGGFVLFVVLVFISSSNVVLILLGAGVGLLIGATIAVWMNRKGVLEGSFITDQDIDSILVEETDKRMDYVYKNLGPIGGPRRSDVAWIFRIWPGFIARRLTSFTRSLMEKGKRDIQ